MAPLSTSGSSASSRPIVGLVPAAGEGARIGRLPCSKELLPVGVVQPRPDRPRVACEFLLRELRDAGAERAYVILRDGKWDIPAYLGDGHEMGLPLAYLLMRLPYGVPYTLDQATPFVHDATVLLGFPDIMFTADRPVYPRLLEALDAAGADVMLGLFPTDRPEKGDMVGLDADGRVRSIAIKSPTTALRTGWVAAAWTPAFTHFLHEEVTRRGARPPDGGELHLGQVLRAALDAGRDVRGVSFPEGRYIDIGTPDELVAYASGTAP